MTRLYQGPEMIDFNTTNRPTGYQGPELMDFNTTNRPTGYQGPEICVNIVIRPYQGVEERRQFNRPSGYQGLEKRRR